MGIIEFAQYAENACKIARKTNIYQKIDNLDKLYYF